MAERAKIMGNLLNNEIYMQDIHKIAHMDIPWDSLKNTTVVISGASGLIGSFLVDVLLSGRPDLGIHVIALVRNGKRAKARFGQYLEKGNLDVVVADINCGVPDITCDKVRYVIHAASNTHPRAYATEPIQTILTNVVGTKNMLELGLKYNMDRFLFLSSVEIYGENRGDIEKFDEKYCGYLDCNTLRAGYPEGKRAGEALCQAYITERKTDIVITRLPRVFGATMLQSDTKALSQFLQKGVVAEDIVLKSKGNQQFSYIYVADAVSGILYSLLNGQCGEAYNVADAAMDITLAELAKIVADYVQRDVVFELPDTVEQVGFSKATKAMLESSKLKSIGWQAQYDLNISIANTLDIMRALNK